VAGCVPVVNVGLYPATAMYVRFNIVKTHAKHWSKQRKQYVRGPVTTNSFMVWDGIHPDLNKNGVDDWIDIDTRTSADANRDGVPDEVQSGKGARSLVRRAG
jgi:hypothetical protein